MREKLVPKEVGKCAGNPGEDVDKVCLEGLDHFFGCITAVHFVGNDLEGRLTLFFYFYLIGGATFIV